MPSSPHAAQPEAVLGALRVEPATGLSSAAVAERRARFGPNLLRRKRRRGPIRILLAQFRGIIVWLLAGAAVLSFQFGEVNETVAIAAVIVINATIGFVTELKAMRSMEALSRIARVAATVRRDGTAASVPAEGLVPGDIVMLEGGDMVTADLRLIQSATLQADEAILTGESVPVGKATTPVAADAPLAERTSMLFKGTAITRGSAEAVVVGIGMDTELGRISALVEEAESEVSPLEKRLDRLSAQLAWITIALTAAITGAGIAAGRDVLLMVETGVALAVAAVPEGLPIVATMALARGMWRMARRNVLIERLSAVETLGSTTVIVTDKTGTMTENRMTATAIALPAGDVAIGPDAGAFLRDGEAVDGTTDPALRAALETMVLCNNAALQDAKDGGATGIGDPMEIALLAAGAKAGLDRAQLLRDLPEHREEAFDPQSKLMATWHRAGEDGFLVAVKGAPEAVLARCPAVLGETGPETLDDDLRDRWQARNRALAAQGLRVLGLARRTADYEDADPYDGLTLVGLVGLLDPPRRDVAKAVAACRQAGIRVVMATGDQAPTAKAIASAVGFSDDAVAVEGGTLRSPDRMTEAARQALLDTDIFARVSPEQKLDLVGLYQQAGQVVAMTGDGVNDAPALKKADIGIAMGLRGSQVAREAADMVLRDDAFTSIVAAVEQGRIIFGNIRKMVLYLLSCNLSEILVVSLAAVTGLPLPLLPLQILYLNLVTDVFPAFALGAGEGEPGTMRQPPRDPRENVLARRHWTAIFGHGAVVAAATLGSYGLALGGLGHDEATAVTMSFLTLALAQLWHVFNMRDRSAGLFVNEVTRNRYVWGALVLCLVLIGAAMHVPVLAEVLRLVPLDATAWSVVVGFSLLPLLVGQSVKRVRSRAA